MASNALSADCNDVGIEKDAIVNQAIKRSIVRWIHIVCGIPIIGYIYSPFEVIPNYPPLLGLSSSL